MCEAAAEYCRIVDVLVVAAGIVVYGVGAYIAFRLTEHKREKE